MTLGRYFRYEIQKKTILLSTIWIISYILVAIIDKSERIKRYLEIGEFIERAQKDKIIIFEIIIAIAYFLPLLILYYSKKSGMRKTEIACIILILVFIIWIPISVAYVIFA